MAVVEIVATRTVEDRCAAVRWLKNQLKNSTQLMAVVEFVA